MLVSQADTRGDDAFWGLRTVKALVAAVQAESSISVHTAALTAEQLLQQAQIWAGQGWQQGAQAVALLH